MKADFKAVFLESNQLTASFSESNDFVAGFGELYRSSGNNNYEVLTNKPQIESVTLIGDKSFEDLGLEEMSAEDIIRILR